MWLRMGTKISVSLTDGSVFTGTVRFTWAPWRGLRLADVVARTQQGDVEAAGELRVPRRSVLYVQVVPR